MDHVHCLLALNADMTIAKAMQLIKGEAAHWANTSTEETNPTKLIMKKLDWADEYYAVSISESMLEKVREYIRNQEEHHQRATFKNEYDEFIRKYKF